MATTQTSTTINQHRSNTFFLLAFGLINTLGFTLLLGSAGLLAGLTIAKWQFPLALIMALAVNYFAMRFFIDKQLKTFIKNSIAILGIIAGSILFAGYFYDVSFDGQWYHQQTILELKHGFNPDHHDLPIPAEEQVTNDSIPPSPATPATGNIKPGTPAINLKYLNINSFSKGAEIIAASIFQLTNRIETGKAINVIILIASFFLCLSLLYKVNKPGKRTRWLLALILAFNPITINELLSFCVDGFAASLLLCLLAAFCLLLIGDNNYYPFLLGVVIVLILNVKFTMIVFAAIFCIGFLVFLIICKKTGIIKKLIITGAIASVLGIFCCGFDPYVTNLVNEHDMFYGLEQTRAEIKRISPPILSGRNQFEQLFLSTFSHQDHAADETSSAKQVLKIPFTFTKSELVEGNDAETWHSGFGPFFSGALCVAAVIILIGLIRFRKTYPFKLAVTTVIIIAITILIMPDTWWQRFIPQLWLIPVIVLCMTEFVAFSGKRILRAILYLSLLLNVAWALLIIVFTLVNTAHINYQLQQLKALGQPVYLQHSYYRYFNSDLERLTEAGIPVTPINNGGHHTYDITYSTTKIITQKPLPDVAGPFMYKFINHLPGKK